MYVQYVSCTPNITPLFLPPFPAEELTTGAPPHPRSPRHLSRDRPPPALGTRGAEGGPGSDGRAHPGNRHLSAQRDNWRV